MLWGGSPFRRPCPSRVWHWPCPHGGCHGPCEECTQQAVDISSDPSCSQYCIILFVGMSLGFNACGNLLEFHDVPSQTKLPVGHDQLVEIRPLPVLINT